MTSLGPDGPDGPLPILLIALTFVTGMVDAVSFLALGRVFVANMTGNVVFLGFALGGVLEFWVEGSLLAIAVFLLGALAGGRLATRIGGHRGRLLAIGLSIEMALVGAAVVIAFAVHDVASVQVRFTLIVLLAFAMGVQNAMARYLRVADLTTTVLTQTLTGLASESTLAGGSGSHQRRRIGAAVAMLAGAALGAAIVLGAGLAAALVVTWLTIAVKGVVAWRLARSTEAWTVGVKA